MIKQHENVKFGRENGKLGESFYWTLRLLGLLLQKTGQTGRVLPPHRRVDTADYGFILGFGGRVQSTFTDPSASSEKTEQQYPN